MGTRFCRTQQAPRNRRLAASPPSRCRRTPRAQAVVQDTVFKASFYGGVLESCSPTCRPQSWKTERVFKCGKTGAPGCLGLRRLSSALVLIFRVASSGPLLGSTLEKKYCTTGSCLCSEQERASGLASLPAALRVRLLGLRDACTAPDGTPATTCSQPPVVTATRNVPWRQCPCREPRCPGLPE